MHLNGAGQIPPYFASIFDKVRLAQLTGRQLFNKFLACFGTTIITAAFTKIRHWPLS